MKEIVTIILLGLNLFTALLLESHVNSGYAGELVLILIGAILIVGILFGIWISANWAFPLSMIVFAVSLINIIWLFTLTNEFLTFAFGLLVNIAGVVMCIAGMDTSIEWQSLETYDIEKAERKRKRR